MFIWQLIFFDCICTYQVDEFNDTMETVYDRENDLTISQVFNANLDNFFKSQNEKESTKQSENKRESLDKQLITDFSSPLLIKFISQNYFSLNHFYSSFNYQKILPRSPPVLIS